MTRSTTLLLLAALSAGTTVGCKSSTVVRDRAERVPEGAKVETAASPEPAPSVHVAAGDLAFAQQNAPEAVRQYRKALELDPKDDEAMYRLATVYAYARQFDEAIAMWKRYNAATGDTAAGQSNLGRTYELAGRWREAEAAYVDSLRKDGSSTTARVNYGILLAKRDRIDEAQEQLAKVLTPAEVQYNLGSVAEIRQDFTTARLRYGKALQLDAGLIAAKQRLDALRAPIASATP